MTDLVSGGDESLDSEAEDETQNVEEERISIETSDSDNDYVEELEEEEKTDEEDQATEDLEKEERPKSTIKHVKQKRTLMKKKDAGTKGRNESAEGTSGEQKEEEGDGIHSPLAFTPLTFHLLTQPQQEKD